MARVSVEDCLQSIPNQFTLCLVAAKRARQLARGANSLLPENTSKSTVNSLREIAQGAVNVDVLNETDLPFQRPDTEMDLPPLSGEVWRP